MVVAQLLLFLAFSVWVKRTPDVPRLLLQGMGIGTSLGLLSDLLLGRYLDFWSYTLGFRVYTSLITAGCIYGIFAANVLLLQPVRLPHFIFCVVVVTVVYESLNYVLRVWTYSLSLSLIGFSVFLFLGYFLTALAIVGMERISSHSLSRILP